MKKFFIFCPCIILLVSLNISGQGESKQCLTIDFEKIDNLSLFEGLPINNQFLVEFGVTFELENGNIPLLARVGGNTPFAFGSSYGNDTPAPGQKVGNYFITDDGKTSNLIAIPLIVKFRNPVDSVSAQVLDMDFDEIFTVTARDINNETIFTRTIEAGDDGTGDGIATTFGFNMPSCVGSIYSLRFEGTRQVAGGFGFAMDNFSFCFTGVDLENAISFNVEGPDCIGNTGSITPLNNGNFECQYSLDGINYFDFDQINGLQAGNIQIFIQNNEDCYAEFDVNIPVPEYPIVENQVTAQTTCGKNNGTIEVIASGENLMFAIDNKPFQNEPIFDSLSSSTYLIQIMNDLGCRDTLMTSILPSIPVIISEVVETNDYCEKSEGSIVINMETSGDYEYFLNNEKLISPKVENLQAGTYLISIKDNFGCWLDTTIMLSSTPSILIANAVSTPTDCQESNGQISFTAQGGSGEISYFLDDFPIDETKITNLDIGFYNISVKDIYGCENRVQVEVKRGKCPVFIPNIISGHSTSVNNDFLLKTLDGYDVGVIKYRIYDRWGNLVFESGNFNIHDTGYWWNGLFKGRHAETGVYAYLIELLHPNGESEYLAGDVTLLR